MAGYIGNAPINNSIFKQVFTPSTGTTTFTPGTVYTPGFIDVYQNGIKLIDTTDYTASNGTTVVLGVAATTGDTIEIVTYETFQSAAPSAYTGNFSVSGTGTVSGAFRHGVLSKSADYTVLSTDANIILVTTSTNNITMTLPAASAVPGQVYRFIKVDSGGAGVGTSSTGRVIIARAGSDTMGINANLTMELWFQDNYVDLMSDGTSRWSVVSTEMFIIPADRRVVSWLPSGGAATSFTDVNYGTEDRVPPGTSELALFGIARWGGNAALDEGSVMIRKNGETVASTGAVHNVGGPGYTNLGSGVNIDESFTHHVQVDGSRIFEYMWSQGSGEATGSLYAAGRGYRLG